MKISVLFNNSRGSFFLYSTSFSFSLATKSENQRKMLPISLVSIIFSSGYRFLAHIFPLDGKTNLVTLGLDRDVLLLKETLQVKDNFGDSIILKYSIFLNSENLFMSKIFYLRVPCRIPWTTLLRKLTVGFFKA